MHLEVCGQVLNSTVDQSTISDYSRGKAFENGTYFWSYIWSPCSTGDSFRIQQAAITDWVNPHVATAELRVTAHGGKQLVNGTFMDVLDGRSARRSQLVDKQMLPGSQIFVNVHPDGLPDTHACRLRL
jgi:hypothetical protein